MLREEHIGKGSEWADGWAVVADPEKFAAKFNSTLPGAYRIITVNDIRQMAHCGLIGHHGFFERADLETVRGILRYEWLRASELGVSSIDLCEQTALSKTEVKCWICEEETKPRQKSVP
jgi:hypothetical protein